MDNRTFDEAIDFARDYYWTYDFCRKMWTQFERLGYLTRAQVDALLRVKSRHYAR